MVLNFASLLLSVFVLASHIVVGAIALGLLQLRGISPLPLFKRFAIVFGVTGVLVFQLYSLMLPQAIAYLNVSYTTPTSGYPIFSGEFVREMIRGLSAGFGPGLLLGVVPFLILAGAGFLVFLRRQWTLASALALPAILTTVFLIVNGLTVSPRFFLLGLPVAILTAIQAISSSTNLLAKKLGKTSGFSRKLATALVSLLSAMSLFSLIHYYSVPKQAYRASLQYIEENRQPGEIVIVIHIAERGYRYYGRDLIEGHDVFFVSSEEKLDAVLSAHGERDKYLVTTFPRALYLVHPELKSRIEKDWLVVQRFPGTIGDGQISVWKEKPF
jgi:hypothetical protein